MKSRIFLETMPFVCQLTEKVYHQAHRIILQTENNDIANRLDHDLWSFNPASFIPHQKDATQECSILIDCPWTQKNTIFINLTQRAIVGNNDISRLLQIVPSDPSIRENARHLYRAYHQQGFTINSHTIEQ